MEQYRKIVRAAGRRLALLGALSAAALATAGAAAGTTAGAADFYCNDIAVPAYSECYIHLNTNGNGDNHNQSYAYHGDGIPVCERATVTYHAANASYRCGSSPVDSQCDLTALYYAPGTAFSMYTKNNDFATVYMDGKGYVGDQCA